MKNILRESFTGGGHALKASRSARFGFTLAEVLITLGIIGVVAALTISTVIQKYNEKVTVTQLEKTYSILSQAFEQAINDNGTIDNWCVKDDLSNSYRPCSDKIAEKIKPYLKTIKTCKMSQSGCLAQKYKFRSENVYGITDVVLNNTSQQFVLSDGSAISFDTANGDRYTNLWCQANKNETSGNLRYLKNCGEIHVDINGKNFPNVVSKDVFYFRMYKDGIAPAGLPADSVWVTSFKDTCLKTKYNGDACAGWVLTNKNMDYLHCDDLSWKGKHSCKEK